MSVVINQIELKNWFNYRGDYENNIIKFTDGLNVVVGDNNSGKTKLHNAIRWLLKNKVIIIEGNDAGETQIKDDVVKKVVNHSVFRTTDNGNRIIIGVRLKFTRIIRGEKQTYLLTKELICRKDVEDLIVLDEIKKVHFIDSRTNKPRTVSEDFDSISKHIISKNFIDFFLIEGEQLGQLTPLEGQQLQNTINSIVYLDVLDHMVLKSNSLFHKVDKLYDEVLNEEENLSGEIKTAIERIQDKKKEVDDLRESILEHEKQKEINQKLVASYRKKAENSGKRKILLDKHEELQHKVEIEETKKESHIRSYISNLMNQSPFGISKIFDDSDAREKLNKQKTVLQTFISKRRTEIKADINEDDQKIIMALEKSQPKPEILQQMVEDNLCYVCNTPLSKKSKDFIENKLIPFFQNETEDDQQLNKIIEIHELIKNIEVESSSYFMEDSIFFEENVTEVIELTNNIIEAQDQLKDFLQINGKSVSDEDDDVNIDTYTIALRKLGEAKDTIEELKALITGIQGDIKKLETLVDDNKGVESKRLKRAESLKSFCFDVNSILKKYKEQTYTDFAKRLELNATKRYQQLMKHNIAKDHKIQVDLIPKLDGNFEFKIDVINKLNEIQDQAGGADQALRRVSVVFALVDIAENKNGFPFIADAPTSRLSTDNKTEFFINLLNDPSLKQSIILTMDLISAQDSKKHDKVVLNKIGQKILNEIEHHDGACMMAIYNNKFDFIKN